LNYTFQFHKKNESERHYMLKQIGKFFLYKIGYTCIGEEIELYSQNELGKKCRTDLLGIKMRNMHTNSINDSYKDLKFDCMSIEAKQSRSDYYNSFVSSADFNYIIIPKGMLTEKDKYIDGVGIIEVDLDLFEFNYYKYSGSGINSKEPFKQGFEITKKPKRNKGDNYALTDGYKKINLLRQVAYRNTVEDLFIRHGIEENN